MLLVIAFHIAGGPKKQGKSLFIPSGSMYKIVQCSEFALYQHVNATPQLVPIVVGVVWQWHRKIIKTIIYNPM
jgi:hypothetical protein